MSQQITLGDALKAWQEFQLQQKGILLHVPDEQLQALADHTKLENRLDILEHVVLCQNCAQKLRYYLDEYNTWVPVKLKAANAKNIKWPKEFVTDDNNFRIKISQYVDNDKQGVLVVAVINPERQVEFEGKTIKVLVNKEQKPIRGTIRNGVFVEDILELDKVKLTEIKYTIT